MDNKKFLKDNLIAKWLDGSLSEHEKETIDSTGELRELKAVIDDIDTWKVKEFDVESGLADLQKRKKQIITPVETSITQNNSYWFQIAASVLVLIAASYFCWTYFSTDFITVKTLVAQQKTIELPDDSEVQLDALSSITYPKNDWENNRAIALKGQAFFKVTKGTTFKVTTNTGVVQVLGTQFNVNTTQNNFKVTCFEGKVAVNYKEEQVVLTKGQSTTLKMNKLYKGNFIARTPNWIDGFVKYNEMSLTEVVKDLERYYPLQIQLPEKYQNLQFTGTLTLKDLHLAMQTLFTSMEIKYTLKENNSVIFK